MIVPSSRHHPVITSPLHRNAEAASLYPLRLEVWRALFRRRAGYVGAFLAGSEAVAKNADEQGQHYQNSS
jgi:hypothetical protein